MTKKRGNPNWAKNVPLPIVECEFDQLVREYGLEPEKILRSHRMRAWAERNANHKYIPEELLDAWGIIVD